MCSYSGLSRVYPGGTPCADECSGCTWTLLECRDRRIGTSCEFTYKVKREGCDLSSDQTFSGTTTVPCDQTVKVDFFCGSNCVGYELTLTGMACPTPPGGGAPQGDRLT